jgi:hypothetical protein
MPYSNSGVNDRQSKSVIEEAPSFFFFFYRRRHCKTSRKWWDAQRQLAQLCPDVGHTRLAFVDPQCAAVPREVHEVRVSALHWHRPVLGPQHRSLFSFSPYFLPPLSPHYRSNLQLSPARLWYTLHSHISALVSTAVRASVNQTSTRRVTVVSRQCGGTAAPKCGPAFMSRQLKVA